MSKLIIVGAGGCGREVMQWALDRAKVGAPWEPAGFIDDNPDALQGLKSSRPLLGSIQDWQPQADELFVCGIAAPQVKKKIVAELKAKGARFIRLIHPTAIVADTATIGEGVVLCPYSVVSDNVCVDEFSFLNIHTTVGHDAVIGAYSTISSFCDITGKTILGSEVFMGSHATVLPSITVGEGAYICAGSVVMTPVKSNSKVLGYPAKKFLL